MEVASFVNAAMLVMAASTFHKNDMTGVGTLESAYLTLQPLLGKAANLFFGISLLASGLSSSTVGTSAGQIIMEGFINKHILVCLRPTMEIRSPCRYLAVPIPDVLSSSIFSLRPQARWVYTKSRFQSPLQGVYIWNTR